MREQSCAVRDFAIFRDFFAIFAIFRDFYALFFHFVMEMRSHAHTLTFVFI